MKGCFEGWKGATLSYCRFWKPIGGCRLACKGSGAVVQVGGAGRATTVACKGCRWRKEELQLFLAVEESNVRLLLVWRGRRKNCWKKKKNLQVLATGGAEDDEEIAVAGGEEDMLVFWWCWSLPRKKKICRMQGGGAVVLPFLEEKGVVHVVEELLPKTEEEDRCWPCAGGGWSRR